MFYSDSFWQQSCGTSWHHTECSPPLLQSVYIPALVRFVITKTTFIDFCASYHPEENLVGHHVTWCGLNAPGRVRLRCAFGASRKQYGVCSTWTVLAALAKRAADVAKTHSCESSRLHQSIGFVSARVQMAEKTEVATTLAVKYSVYHYYLRALWQKASVWALSVASLLFYFTCIWERHS